MESSAPTARITDFDTLYSIVTRDYAGYQDRMRENGPRITLPAPGARGIIAAVTVQCHSHGGGR